MHYINDLSINHRDTTMNKKTPLMETQVQFEFIHIKMRACNL